MSGRKYTVATRTHHTVFILTRIPYHAIVYRARVLVADTGTVLEYRYCTGTVNLLNSSSLRSYALFNIPMRLLTCDRCNTIPYPILA